MKLPSLYLERVGRRPDSEPGQALLRTVIVWLLLINTAWVAARVPEIAAQLWAINLFSAAFSVLLFARILQRPQTSFRRRILGAIHDNVAITAWLYTCGPAGALALFVYSFVTVGNGFRFGVSYLASSGLLGAVGIGVLFTLGPGWDAYGLIGVGFFTSHVVVTAYTGLLLNRLRQSQNQLERMATSDVLTGLPNRRFFLDRLSQIVAARACEQMACLFMDLDGFKAVNDRHGHKAGDELLCKVAEAIRASVSPGDIVARLGGDEFTVVLDNLRSRDHARSVAERIIQKIEAIGSVTATRWRCRSASAFRSSPPASWAGRTCRKSC